MKRVTKYTLFLHPEEKINVYLMYKCITFPTVTIKKIFLNPSEEKPVVHEGDSKLSFGMPGEKNLLHFLQLLLRYFNLNSLTIKLSFQSS